MSLSPPILQNPQLQGNSFYWEGEKPIGILLFHGFTATTAEVRPLGRFFHQAGLTVSGPLLPGHGTSPEDLNRCKWQDWVEAAERAYLDIKSKCNRVYVSGESMGGLIALYLASMHPEIKGLLLYATALIVPGLSRSILLSPFVKSLPKRQIDESMPWQGYRVNPLKAASQLFYFQKEVRRCLPKITQPTLICHGLLDQTVSPNAPGVIHQLIGSMQKQIILFEKSRHCMILDIEFDKIAQTSLEFIMNLE